MATTIEDAAFTEPNVIPDVFVTGAAVESSNHIVRIVGWVQLPYLSGDAEERRIVVRFVMAADVAIGLRDDLIKHLTRQDGS